MDTAGQLDRAQMKIAKLTREKKQLQREVDESRQREAKLKTQLSWQRIQNKRDQREREIAARRRLRDMQEMMREEAQREPFLPREMIDDELADALDVVYALESNIQTQLEQINVDTIETENAKIYLDTSFETISMLIEQTRQQRSAIATLRGQIAELTQELEAVKMGTSSTLKEPSPTPDTDVAMDDVNSDLLTTYSATSDHSSQRIEDLEAAISDNQSLIQRYEDTMSQKDAEIERLKRSYEQKLENLDTAHKMEMMSVRQEMRLKLEEMTHRMTSENRDLKNEVKLKRREVELKEDEIRSLLTLQKTLQEQIHALKSQNQHLQYQIDEMKRKLERRERYIRNQDLKQRNGNSVVACHCW